MTTFYVSPSGNDGSSGLSATASGSNGPFATIARALQAMRASSGSDVLYIEGGTYAQGTINLTSADSGDSFQAYQGQQAVISGGTAVTGWTVGSNGVWQAHVSLSDVEQLVVNGVPQTDARFPNSVPSNPIDGGWLWAQTLPGGDNPSLQMAYNKSDFPAGMQPTAGEKVTVFAQWGYSSDVLTIKLGQHQRRGHHLRPAGLQRHRSRQPVLHQRRAAPARPDRRILFRSVERHAVLQAAGRFRRQQRRGGGW